MTVAYAANHRFTRDQYYRMADAGVFQGQRVELIEGEIVDKAPQNNRHAVALGLVLRSLLRAFPESDFWVRVQSPMNLGPNSAPEPDFAVVRGSPRDFQDHPTSAQLLVEISDTTLSFDQITKQTVYAKAGIPEYWVVNIPGRKLEVYRNPAGDSYAEFLSLSLADTVSPVATPIAKIHVADLLP